MKNNLKDGYFEEKDFIFDDYFENMNLNSEMEKIYDIINDDELSDKFEKENKLTDMRNENHNRYSHIDIYRIKQLPQEFKDVVDNIVRMYDSLDSKILLIEDYNNALNSKRTLDKIDRNIHRLERMLKTTIKDLTYNNDNNQKKFNINYFNSLDLNSNLRITLIEKYNALILYSSTLPSNIYDDLQIQLKRKQYIREILEILNLEEENKLNIKRIDKLKDLNYKISLIIDEFREKLNYLQDLMPEGSKYKNEYEEFSNFYNKIIAYDDTSYENTKQTYEILSNDLRFKDKVIEFETLFIKEIEGNKKEEKFIYNKIGIKNIKSTLRYIETYYLQFLNQENKDIVNNLIADVNSENKDLNDIESKLNKIIKYIWSKSITDVYDYNPNDNFCFICSNNQFIDEKQEAILITNIDLQQDINYENYQIGFICSYNDNILYITENEDIMSVQYNDMSNLKTPIQVVRELLKYNVRNKLVLNGYDTKIEAVYYINDGNFEKYKKALELANAYNLPLIELKK